MSRVRWFRYFSYCLEILVLFMLQETPGLIPEAFGQRPVFLIPAVLCIALFENELPAMAFGALAGLLIDSGISGVLGFHGLMLAVCCYFISAMAANLIRTNFLTALLVCAVGSTLVMVLQWVFYFWLAGYEFPDYAFVNYYLPRLAYTSIWTPVTYYFNRALALFLRPREE